MQMQCLRLDDKKFFKTFLYIIFDINFVWNEILFPPEGLYYIL